MQKFRSGEHKIVPFRNERYFCSNGVWYFETRGGKHKGPYADKQEMEAELLLFIREQRMLNQSLKQS